MGGQLLEIDLDPIGGVAGDMFVAAMLDAFPEHEAAVRAAATAAAPVRCRLVGHQDTSLRGRRFEVRLAEDDGGRHAHHHTAWRDIRRHLQAVDLPTGVVRHAVAIFALLAEAEGRVHGVPADAVTFHEVGAADSIADIVAAAWLIDAVPVTAWRLGPVPLGSGRITTAHGIMPVPAPATALLLEGLVTVDDGIAGERVTPTGAAILRHLASQGQAARGGRVLKRSGLGFGTRFLPGISNCLRVLAFEPEPAARSGDAAEPSRHRELAVVRFEVDDQSAEDLALGLDHLRALPGVHDVLQMPAFGKKGRMMTHVQVLAAPAALDAVIAACFVETTTIGLRHEVVQGIALPREEHEVEVDGRRLRLKTVRRPGGPTAKAEADDVAAVAGHAARFRLRRAAADLALRGDATAGGPRPLNEDDEGGG